MRLAALLLLLALPSCGMVGHTSQRSIEAAGIVGTAAVATPVVAFLSWPLWNYLGGYGSAWLTGTEEIRVEAGSGAGGSSGGLSVPSPTAAILGGNNTMLYLLLAVAFMALGGPAWALKKIKDAKTADDAWVVALDKDRAEHAKATAALTAKVELLERIVAQRPIIS